MSVLCTCPTECDCQAPDADVAGVSEHCPDHNHEPKPYPDCPEHGEDVSQHPLAKRRAECEFNAWDSLSRYKYSQFGYWAAHWKVANDLCGELGLGRVASPFADLVKVARARGFGPKVSRQKERRA